jgi:integrase
MAKRRGRTYANGGVRLGQREGGEAVADYRDEDAGGKRRRVRLGVQFADFEAAKAALDKFADNRKKLLADQRTLTVNDVWAMWLREREADGFNNDIYRHQYKPMGAVFGTRSPLLLEAQDFRDYAQSRFDAGKAPATVNTELRRLSSCFKWAAETRKLPFRVKVWVPAAGGSRERVLSIVEAQALVRAAEQGDPHVYLFVVLAFATGARHTAILDLTWDRIDFVSGKIQYDEDLPPNPMSRSYKKGRATVPMNRAARAALEIAYAGRQTDYVIEHGGKRLKAIHDGFRAAVVRAGLGHLVEAPTPNNPGNLRVVTDVTPHTIRHTVATWLDALKIADKRTAQLLGHSDEETTKKHYTHASFEVLSEAVEHLDAAFAPLPKIGFEENEDEAEAA